MQPLIKNKAVGGVHFKHHLVIPPGGRRPAHTHICAFICQDSCTHMYMYVHEGMHVYEYGQDPPNVNRESPPISDSGNNHLEAKDQSSCETSACQEITGVIAIGVAIQWQAGVVAAAELRRSHIHKDLEKVMQQHWNSQANGGLRYDNDRKPVASNERWCLVGALIQCT